MKLIKRNKVSVLLITILFISSTSCNIQKKIPVTVLGAKNCWVEVYNGKRLIMADSMNSSPITGVSKITLFRFKFNDTLKVIVRDKYGEHIKKAKIPRSNRVYIDKSGLNFKLIGTNRIMGGI